MIKLAQVEIDVPGQAPIAQPGRSPLRPSRAEVEQAVRALILKPETVKTRLHRARHLLREALEKQIGPVLTDAFPFDGRRCERMTQAVLARIGRSASDSGR